MFRFIRCFYSVLVLLLVIVVIANTSAYAQQKMRITKIENVTSKFDTTKLSKRAKFTVRFAAGGGEYAFDEGREEWYQNSKLIRDDLDLLSLPHI